MHDINELIRIINGINFDGVINEKEADLLQAWVNKNRELTIDTLNVSLLKTVNSVLESHAISNCERESILDQCSNYKEVSSTNVAIHELKDIIEGLKCDDELDAKEIYRLKGWISENRDDVTSQGFTSKLFQIIDNILEDNKITKKEQQVLLQLLSARINDSQIRTKIEYLCKQVKAHENIGLDLIDLLDNENAIKIIHDEAERQLAMALRSYMGSEVRNPEIVFVSLVLIAMLHYDAGNFYRNVRTIYADLYKIFSDQKIEGLIRTIINKYRTIKNEKDGKARIINIVLSNSIVPRHYLRGFFEFLYDIYKLNFNFTLVDDLYKEFEFIYEGLRTSMLSDGDDVKINVTKKTYKLIKTTKQLITDKNSVDAVINLSIIVIKIIDKQIWNQNIQINNPYLEIGFKEWADTLKDDISDSTRNSAASSFRSSWQPRFFMMNNEVYLAPPLHKVKSDNHYWEISAVVLNDGIEIYSNTEPDIREIIGGYRVSIEPIVVEKPLGTLTYRLVTDKSVIYDSGEKLYRDFLVFDSNGDEISNNTDYTGTAIFVYSSKQNNLSSYKTTTYYDVASQNIHVGDTCLIGDMVFNFSALFKPGVFGEKYLEHFIIDDISGKEMPVFKAVEKLIFESNQLDATFEIILDGISRKISDFEYKISAREGVNKYIVELPMLDIGIHTFIVNQITKGKRIKLLDDYSFAIDPILDTKIHRLNDETYVISVESSIGSVIEREICADKFEPNGLAITYKDKKYYYCIPFDFDFYKLSGQNWKSFKDGLWIGDIKQESIIEIYGNDIDGILISSSVGTQIEDVPKLKKKRGMYQIPVGFLATFKGTYDYVVMWFTKNGLVNRNKVLFCDFRCNLKDNETNISFEPVTKILSVIPYFNGKGQVYVNIINSIGNCVYRSNYIESGCRVEIGEIESFTEYTIQLLEKEKGLSLKPDRLMKEYKQKFYAWDDFIGKSFKISEIEYIEVKSGSKEEKIHEYSSMRMEFIKKLSEDTYLGRIYIDGYENLPQYERLNPVEIHIEGSIIDEKLDISCAPVNLYQGDGINVDG